MKIKINKNWTSLFYIQAALLLCFNSLVFAEPKGEFQIQKSDFLSLFNEFRISQADPMPWAGSFWSFSNEGINSTLLYPGGEKTSPLKKWDDFFGLSGEAVLWENEEHSCKNQEGSMKKNCQEWWGHCQAWSAASLMEVEPKKTILNKGVPFYQADQKAYLTELWMESGSLFVGSTQKEVQTNRWIFSSDSITAQNRDLSSGRTYFDSFWDISPKTFFLIFTNYLGIQKKGVVIDRFTGNEVWNQPAVAYRILPIREFDVQPPIIRDHQQIYPVVIRMKIYWATDHMTYSGKDFHHHSTPFEISSTKDLEDVEKFPPQAEFPDYTGRFLSFELFFDRPIVLEESSKTDAGYTKIESIGRMVGYGLWTHQKQGEVGELHTKDMDHKHPDFIWKPTSLEKWSHAFGSPFLKEKNVRSLLSGKAETLKSPSKMASPYSLSLLIGNSGIADPTDTASIKRKIKFILEREGIQSTLYLSDIKIHPSQNEISVFIKSIDINNVSLLRSVFELADLEIRSLQITTDFKE